MTDTRARALRIAALTTMVGVLGMPVVRAATMIVPSSNTDAALEKLSRESDIIADILTVDRNEVLMRVDGNGGGALSGELLTPESVSRDDDKAPSATRIPFEKVALVYAAKIRTGKYAVRPFYYPEKDSYPSVPAPGLAEQNLDCDELDTDIARVGAIRWYARQHSHLMPFTPHEATVQHARNAAKDVGVAVLVAAVVIGCSGGGGCGGFNLPSKTNLPLEDSITPQEFRWAITRADTRELGLLEIKNRHSCPARKSPDSEVTDLEILEQVDATRASFKAGQISDVDQRDQQTQLLDKLDPQESMPVRLATASDYSTAAAAANDRKAESLAGAVLDSSERYVVVERPQCKFPMFGWPMTGPSYMGGPFHIRERGLVWMRDGSERIESIEYKDLGGIEPLERHYGVWYLPIRKVEGGCMFLALLNQSRDSIESARTNILARISIAQHAQEAMVPEPTTAGSL